MKRFALALSTIVVGVVVAAGCAVGVRQPATDITERSAVLNGKVLSTTGGPGSWFIRLGAAGTGVQTPIRPIEFVTNESEPVSEPAGGLTPGTTYHFAVCAEDGENPGNPFCSPEQTFTTDFDPTGDAVAGQASDCTSETVPCTSRTFLRVDAHSDPDGASPDGTVNWGEIGQSPGASSSTNTEVTCLSVNGNVAIIGVTGTTHQFIGDFATAGLIRVTDQGGPNSGQDTFEFATESGPPLGPPIPGPTDCSSFPAGKPAFVNDDGDLIVVERVRGDS